MTSLNGTDGLFDEREQGGRRILIKIFTFLRQYDSINIFRIIYIFSVVRRAGVGRVVIGVDLGGTNLRTALLSPDGDIL
ncbi:MAG TPA: hypothetical protein VF819_05450, partial [Nitrospira sp.]